MSVGCFHPTYFMLCPTSGLTFEAFGACLLGLNPFIAVVYGKATINERIFLNDMFRLNC
jgi:hypothetical protein